MFYSSGVPYTASAVIHRAPSLLIAMHGRSNGHAKHPHAQIRNFLFVVHDCARSPEISVQTKAAELCAALILHQSHVVLAFTPQVRRPEPMQV